MDNGIIIALIFGVSSIITSICFGLVPSVRKQKIEHLEKKINVLLSDIKMLYYIEDELLNRLECYGKNKRAEKNEVRKIISKKNNGCMLSKNAQPNVFNKRLSK